MNYPTQLIELIRRLDRCIVAFSGGVDSAVVAKAAQLALGDNKCLAVTAVSPSVALSELEIANEVANQIGIQHRTIRTHEIENPDYVANDGQRCFHCKSELYTKLGVVANQLDGDWVILNGTNRDDLGDYRPGLRAAHEFEVRSPLVELEIDKKSVRQIARHWDLKVWDKPAAPCLASRIAYGEPVSVESLKMVEAAEAFLRNLQFRQLRVRYLPNTTARVEVDPSDLHRLQEPTMLARVVDSLREIGFAEVEVDPEGFRSGKLNRMLPTYGIGSE